MQETQRHSREADHRRDANRGPQAVQFGAGNIGRGFMGQLLHEAGYHITFIDAAVDLVTALEAEGRYPLRVLDAEQGAAQDLVIDNFSAVLVTDRARTDAAIAAADVVFTAVGVRYLGEIAPVLVSGLRARRAMDAPPLDVYLCENLLDAAGQLCNAVSALISEDERGWLQRRVGFVGTSVARMVPVLPSELRAGQPLLVVADGYHKLPYDAAARRAPQPPIDGMYAVPDFAAEGERKLFIYNMAHAALAYLGHQLGLQYVHQTFDDAAAMQLFRGALDEACAGLAAARPGVFSADQLAETRADILLRFANPMLQDTIDRVGRDPIRKLGRSDRLVGCALMCLRGGVRPHNITAICAAALRYDRAGDPDAERLQTMIRDRGPAQALAGVSGLDPSGDPDRKLISMVMKHYDLGA
ncbi:MAG: hypothetical protein EA404_09535 [Spirochaetaceae bacterium]|nr:MAG: hypothetical protein EA404_09535 [Spirochaetaceae bacterium]